METWLGTGLEIPFSNPTSKSPSGADHWSLIFDAGYSKRFGRHFPTLRLEKKAKWRDIIGHMTKTRLNKSHLTGKRAAGRDFTLYFLTPETPEQDVRSAFKNKWEWVVSYPTSLPAWYSTVLSNLSRTYSEAEKANIENVREILTKGLSKGAFERLKSVIATSGDNLCQVVRIPPRTLARRTVFKPDESERILRVAAAFQRAVEVLEDLDGARRWFSTPKRALGEKTPLEFCDTEPGAEEVMNLLGRIEHGVFS